MLKPSVVISSETNFLDGTVLLFNKPITWSSFDVVKKVRNKFSQMWNWIKEKVTKAFDFIKTLGANMLNGLFKFFGIEPNNVGLTGKGPELFTQ